MKSKDTRLSETVTFIRNCLALDAGQRTRAADQADSYIDSLGGQSAALSTSLHIGDSGPDLNQHRAYRRAYVLLYKAIAHGHQMALTGLPQGVITIAGPTAVANLPAVVRFAAILRCRETMANYMMLQDLQQLLNSPLQFLQHNKLMVSGSPRRDVGQGDRNVMPFYLSYDLNNERYDLTPDPQPGCAPVMADSVVARWWTDIPGHVAGNLAGGNFSQLEGIELTSQLMVTTQFTGCAFAMKNHNAHTYCAHTTPKPPHDFAGQARAMTGNQLAQDIHSVNGVAGDFQNAAGGPALAIYGAGWSVGTIGGVSYPMGLGGGGNYMTIIGTPAGGGIYHIFSQITQNRAITSAQRIF